MEEWRPVTIPEFVGLYEVSNLGRVRSVDRISVDKNGRRFRRVGQIIRQSFNGKGPKKYPHVVLSQNGQMSGFTVHRLVALAFIPNPLNLPEVNHIDAVKTNNAVTNLEWATETENRNHAKGLGLYLGSKVKVSDDQVIEIRDLFSGGTKQTTIARLFNVSAALVCLIVNGRHRVTPRP